MPSDSLLAPRFPSLTQDTLFSFYTRPVVRRHKTDQSLLNPRSPYLKANKPSTAKNTIILSASPSGTAQTHGELLVDHLKRKEGDLIAASPILSSADDAGPWPAESSASVKAAQKKAVERVQLRALMTKLPAGAALSADEHRLNMTEMNWLDEWASLNEVSQFGDRFLLPYGRRQTQLELDAMAMANASPTPSQGHFGQEDRGVGSAQPAPAPPLPEWDGEPGGDGIDEDGDQVDLDADVEDMDASGFSED